MVAAHRHIVRQICQRVFYEIAKGIRRCLCRGIMYPHGQTSCPSYGTNVEVYLMKNYKIVICLLSTIFCSNFCCASKGQYEPVGPNETASLEKELRYKLAGYNCGFWPRSEKLVGAIPGKSLPKEFIHSIESWLPKVLTVSLLPEKLDPNNWLGVRKLYFNRNRIIGRFSPHIDPNTVVEFKGAYRSLDITIHSETLFQTSTSEMTNERIKEMLAKILRIPNEKKDKIEIKSHIEKLADVDICYGKMFCEWTEESNPFKTERRWWSYVPFWYKKGMIFVSITTVEKDDLPHATFEEH
jgi:hypothetical protein